MLSPEKAVTFKYNVLDLTKYIAPRFASSYAHLSPREWGFDDAPKTEIGKFYLTQNPSNYFAEIEQAAFSPARMVKSHMS